jgi:hypothetical protein
MDFVHRLGNSKEIENMTFRKLDLFPSSGERKETPIIPGPLETATSQSMIPLILSALQHRQNPLDSEKLLFLLYSYKSSLHDKSCFSYIICFNNEKETLRIKR